MAHMGTASCKAWARGISDDDVLEVRGRPVRRGIWDGDSGVCRLMLDAQVPRTRNPDEARRRVEDLEHAFSSHGMVPTRVCTTKTLF